MILNRRKIFLDLISTFSVLSAGCTGHNHCVALAFQAPKGTTTATTTTEINGEHQAQKLVAYKQLTLPLKQKGFGDLEIPIACWFPMDRMVDNTSRENFTSTCYQHRISVRRIGQMLARWDFIPAFASRDYSMTPSVSSSSRVIDGTSVSLPSTTIPVVLLAHGYLGSRFDLSHLAEALAANGFLCLAAEYPESLAASYECLPGLDRTVINDVLLETLETDWQLQVSAFGICGHSLGCGTVAKTGDSTWARVSIAGFPMSDDTRNGLFISSMNDGAVSLAKRGGLSLVNHCYSSMLQETSLDDKKDLPHRAALVFDRPDAPNHISFLAEGVNDAMLDFLSPLLPIAQAFEIPVLDFDRYQVSRDSKVTAEILIPLVVRYLKQEMLGR